MAVAVPTLDFLDAADGTGGALTISGSTSGATNTFYTQPLDSSWYGDQGWTSRGSRSGNGDIAVSLAPGLYMGYVHSTSGVESNVSLPLQFRASEERESIYYQILKSAQARIKLLNLNEINNSSIVAWKMPLTRAVSALTSTATGKKATFPVVMLTTMDAETINADAGTNARDDIGYPVGVAMVSLLEGEYAKRPEYDHLETGHDRHLLWRERIRKAFLNQRLPGVREVNRCVVEPRVPQIAGLLGDNLEGSAMVLRFFTRETRGLT